MDKDVWRMLTAAVRSADRRAPRHGRRMQFSDQQIARMYLWSVGHDRPLCWACDHRHYNTLFRPRQLPSVSQFCRRVKTPRVQALLNGVHAYLTRSETSPSLSFLDGKPLPVSWCSRDPDARVGFATKGFAKGYKLHVWATSDDRIPGFSVRPMNEGEAQVARGLASGICGGLVMADAHLYQALGRRGAQLLTPLKRIAVNPGPLHRMGPERRLAIQLHRCLQEKNYRLLLERRDQVERIFSALSCFGGGLTCLPSWVRRLDRVTRWVSAKIDIYHARLKLRRHAS